MFSSRVPQAGRNRLALALDERRAAGLPILDLTESNPTSVGLDYPQNLLACLSQPSALRYRPAPFGLRETRVAVAADFSRRGIDVGADRIVLTASTSEAYSLLLKLLCDAGDRVLAPRPSYPLVEHLTTLEGVAVVQYPLDFHSRWAIDVDAINRGISDSRARAVIIVSPNNPTGSVASPAELDELRSVAGRQDVALIADEVFADYPIAVSHVPSALNQSTALTFVLGGLSKSVGLPQVKLGWIAVSGPDHLANAALERLETICDTYLSVATPVQAAALSLLDRGAAIRSQIQRRIVGNDSTLRAIASSHGACTVLPTDAGWYSVVQVPAVQPEETLVVQLLQRCGVLVHPGYFFDFDREAFLVVSLLPEPSTFAEGVSALFAEIDRL
jgi:aspartate/methionine/tyrosine aminotransferase